jgi:hypothetical protein
MKNTYTYTARSAENPEHVVTFTLIGNRMSVGVGAPLEKIEQTIEIVSGEEEEAQGEGADLKLWIKPMAVSLVERGTEPFRIADVDADVYEDRLSVRGWVRTGGLRLAPITITEGRVDNPDAARAFADEVAERKAEAGGPLMPFALFDYWATWFATGIFLLGLFKFWRQRVENE